MSLLLCAFAVLIPLSHPTAATSIPEWRKLLFKAEEVSMQGHRTDEMRRRGQDSAIVLAKATMKSARESGASCADLTEIQAALGNYYYRKSDTAMAAKVWRATLDSLDHCPGASPRQFEPVLHRLGMICADAETKGGVVSEDQCDARARRFRAQVWDSFSPDSPRQLLDLAEIYARLERNEDFDRTCQRLVEVDDSLGTGNPWYVVRALIFQAEGISKSIDFVAQNGSSAQDSAVKLGERALAIASSRVDSVDTSIAFAANRLGDYYSRLGNDDRAVELWDRAWRINRKALPPEHIENQGSIFRMASVFRAQGRYAEAEELYNQAVSLSEKMYGHRHPETAYKYNALGSLYRLTGRYEDAARCYETALEIRQAAVQYNESEIAQILCNLGNVYSDQGRYARAEQLYLKALELRESLLGKSHGLVGQLEETIADLYLAWGRTGDAREMLERALKVKTTFFGARHSELVSTLQGLADVCQGEGHLDSAITLLRQALNVISEQPRWEKRSKAECLLQLARLELANGHADQCERLAREALAIHNEFLQPSDPRLTPDYDLIARACAQQSKLASAQAAFQSIIAFDTSLSTIKTQAMARGYEDYAVYSLEHGDHSLAWSLAAAAYRIRWQHLHDAARVMSEHDALVFADRLLAARNLLISAYLVSPMEGTAASDSALAMILSSKDVVTDEMVERARRPLLQSDALASQISDSLRYVRVRMAGLYLKGPQDENTAQYEQKLSDLSTAKRRLEEEFARHVGFDGPSPDAMVWSTGDISTKLPNNAQLIEYVRFDRISGDRGQDVPYYLAAVLSKDRPSQLIELGPAAAIDSCVSRYRAHLEAIAASNGPPGTEARTQYGEISRCLYEHIWQPLAGELSDTSTVLIAPDGELNLVSFAGLVEPDGKYLIERHAVHYVTSSNEVGRTVSLNPRGSGLLAVGDPDFDATSSSLNAPASSALEPAVAGTDQLTSLRSACRDLDSLKLTRLAGAREEVKRAAALWASRNTGRTTVLTGSEATEANFKRAAPGHQVIHLATHGFFLRPECRSVSTKGQEAVAASVVNDNPLLLSGLCLAGANKLRLSGDSASGEDGILTAEEVCSLDLKGTDWVILSSCESGLGRVVTGEGIYGLRRSFLMAGARTVFSTLWPIPDMSTRELTRRLYSEPGTNIPKMLQAAALATLADLRKRGQPDHPYNWAAFISLGAWQSQK